MLKPSYQLPPLPPPGDMETREILLAAMEAHRHLAELKGRAAVIPNQSILVDTLLLQEAMASSEIENIVATQDELFRIDLLSGDASRGRSSSAAKEVARYRDALKHGYALLRDTRGLVTNNLIIEIYQMLKRNTGGFRVTPGTKLMNEKTGGIVYVPPQDACEISAHMTALERFINDDRACALDPLLKMALIHHQFESIHPFPDGNGRIGRILNVLYLTHTGLLDSPILYLSRAIIRSKGEYYRRLQAVREQGAWEAWILYMLRAVSQTSRITLELIEGIRSLMTDYKHRIRDGLPQIYSQELLNNLFRHPYTRIEFVQRDLQITRQTAAKYLDALADAGLVKKQREGRNNYYINAPLVKLFLSVSREPDRK